MTYVREFIQAGCRTRVRVRGQITKEQAREIMEVVRRALKQP